jgi:hypothetical protein
MRNGERGADARVAEVPAPSRGDSGGRGSTGAGVPGSLLLPLLVGVSGAARGAPQGGASP